MFFWFYSILIFVEKKYYKLTEIYIYIYIWVFYTPQWYLNIKIFYGKKKWIRKIKYIKGIITEFYLWLIIFACNYSLQNVLKFIMQNKKPNIIHIYLKKHTWKTS